jgi:MFS transporter, ACS family, tartrate transporter
MVNPGEAGMIGKAESAYDPTNPLHRTVVRKVALRLIPMLGMMYSIAYLDRINIGSAALTMNKDLHIDATTFGFASSMFLAGYFFLEIPSNIALVRFGARIWLTRIMLTWGILSSLTGFIQNGQQLVIARVLLGIAEAGFFPGMVLYLALWFPREVRARMFFCTTLPLAIIFGAPLSTAIIQYTDGWFGFAGWRNMYIAEGIPAIVLSYFTARYLTSTPEEATWLTEAERNWLISAIEVTAHTRQSLMECFRIFFRDFRLTLYALAYGLLQLGFYAVLIFTPQVIANLTKTFGQDLSVFQVGVLTSLPALIGAVLTFLWVRHSDLTHERSWHSTVGSFIAAVGAVMAAYSGNIVVLLIGLTLLKGGMSCALVPLWQLPTKGLATDAAGVVVAMINSVGILFSFISPIVVGWLKDSTGSYSAGLIFLAVTLVMACLCIVWARFLLDPAEVVSPEEVAFEQ